MFRACKELRTLTLGDNFTTANVTNMSSMFSSCEWLRPLDVSKFNTSNVTDMSYMFNKCEWLETLDVSNFNTSKVTNMAYMFTGCSALTSLDVSNFDFSALVDGETAASGHAHFMFSECTGLTSINLPSTGLTKLASNMFYKCTGLTSIVIPASVTTVETNAFHACSSSLVINCVGAEGCIGTNPFSASDPNSFTVNYDYRIPIALKSGSEINDFFTTLVDKKGYTSTSFAKASSLEDADYTIVTEVFGEKQYLDAENSKAPLWVTEDISGNATVYYYIEDYHSLLVGDGEGMFIGSLTHLTTIDVSDFDVSQAISLASMFAGESITTIYAKAGTDWSLTAPEEIISSGMFSGSHLADIHNTAGVEMAFVGTKVIETDSVTGYFTAKE